MLSQWIEKKLIQKRDRERQQVIKLKWQQAELERKIEVAKRTHQAAEK